MKFIKIILFSLILNFVNSEVFSMRTTPEIRDESQYLLDQLEERVNRLISICESNDINMDNLNQNIKTLFNIYVKLEKLIKSGTFSEKIYFVNGRITIIERMRDHRVVEFIEDYINQNNLNNTPFAINLLHTIR